MIYFFILISLISGIALYYFAIYHNKLLEENYILGVARDMDVKFDSATPILYFIFGLIPILNIMIFCIIIVQIFQLQTNRKILKLEELRKDYQEQVREKEKMERQILKEIFEGK